MKAMKAARRGPGHRAAPVKASPGAGQAGRWRPEWMAGAVVLLSLGLRVYFAVTYQLNPDEGFHFLFAHQPTPRLVRLETISPIHAYPPLYVFLLHLVLLVSDSEFALRLPALLFGTVFLWVAFVWMRRLFGAAAALGGLLILAFSPGTVSLGYEVRNYALLLAGVGVTLYALDRTFAEQSARWMAAAMMSLYVAILTNYSAAWVCLALGVYVGGRALARHLSGRLVWQWVLYQAGGLAIYAWLYETHIRDLMNSGTKTAMQSVFRASYYWPGTDDPVRFVIRQSVAVLRYLFELETVAWAGGFLFLGGMIWLALGREGEASQGRWTVLLLSLPPVLGCVLALARLNPFGHSRHSAIFLPFLAAGMGYGMSLLAGRRPWVIAALGAIVVPLWMGPAYRHAWYIPAPGEKKQNIENAVAFLRTLPKGTLIFADHESIIGLGYYLGRDAYSPYYGRPTGFVEFNYDGYRVGTFAALWSLKPEEFVAIYNDWLMRHRAQPQDAWVFDSGPVNLGRELPKAYPGLRLRDIKWFGDRISAFQVSNSK